MVLGYFQGFEHDHGQKNSSARINKIDKIRSVPAKYNVFYITEASSIICCVAQYRVTKNSVTLIVPRLSLSIKKKKGVVRWDLEGPISSGYLAHCSHPFFTSIRIEFSASYSMLSQSLVTPTSLDRLFINPEFCQCPLRRSCQLQLF